jgi:hypothetical protein
VAKFEYVILYSAVPKLGTTVPSLGTFLFLRVNAHLSSYTIYTTTSA